MTPALGWPRPRQPTTPPGDAHDVACGSRRAFSADLMPLTGIESARKPRRRRRTIEAGQ